MGLFFKKAERKKSSKSLSTMKNIMLVTMILLLVLALISWSDLIYLRIVFILVGVLSIIEGIESYFHKEDKKVYLAELGFGAFYFILTFIVFG